MLLSSLMLLAAASAAPDAACIALPSGVKATAQAPASSWYINSEAIQFGGKSYTKYGLPRVLVPGDVTYGAIYKGVPIGVDPMADTHEVIYLLVRDSNGCEFQPYQIDG